MATRTIQFLGQGYGNTPVTVTAVWDGNTIYNGTVPTVNAPVSILSTTTENNEILFTTDVDVTLESDVPMTIEVTNGTLVVGQIIGNFANVRTRVGNVITLSSSGPTTFLEINNIGDARNTPTLNGTLLVPNRADGQEGTWPWAIPSGSTFTCNVDIDSGCL